jgi:hydroxymethylbilane synthase
MILNVGTRGSKLSRVQTELVADLIKQRHPDVKLDLTVITTSGDRDQRTPLFSLDQKGIFEKEIDQAVLEGQVDFAVHSMKDIPVFDADSELVIASVPERGSVADVLVSRDKRLKELRSGSKVGTSSLLRAAELRRMRPDLVPKPIRGNVETRIQKVDAGEFDAVVLADAGLVRLGMTGRISELLPIEDFIPAPGQGALALVARRDNLKVIELLKTVESPVAKGEIEAEREIVRILEGGCKVPIGALARAADDGIRIIAGIFSIDGKERILAERSGPAGRATVLAREIANELVAKGGKRVEQTWRTIYA